MKPTRAWAVVNQDGDLWHLWQSGSVYGDEDGRTVSYATFVTEATAKQNCWSYCGDTTIPVIIVPADEWERLNAILTRAVGALAAWENMYPDSGPKDAAQVIEEYEGAGGRNSG